MHPGENLETILKNSRENHHHLAQWVRNSHQLPPLDHESSFEEWTAEELAARTPKGNSSRSDITAINSDMEQQSTTSSTSLSTVKSNNMTRKNGGHLLTSKENTMGSISICRRCHR